MNFGKLSACIVALVVAFSFNSSSTFAESYPKNIFSVNQLHFDATRSPRGIDWYLQSREGIVIVKAIAAYMGIPIRYVTLAYGALAEVYVPSDDSEETHYKLTVPDGYAYCSSRIAVESMVPASGADASYISASVYPGGVGKIYTVTPVQGITGGRSWVEGDLQITGILPQYLNEFIQKGICAPLTAQVGLIECKGNPCSPGYHGGSHKGEVAQKAPKLAEGF